MKLKDLNREQRNIIILFLIGIIFWLSLVFYREYYQKDVKFMRKTIIDTCNCNGWCFGHFLHYTVLGYCAPSYWLELIIIGILFELIEIPLNSVSRFIDSKLYQDTLTNSLGVLTGITLYHLYPKKVDLWGIIDPFRKEEN